jgi:hypothetical protein
MTYTLSFTVPVLLVSFALLVWKASPDRLLNRRFTTFSLMVALWATSVTAVHGGAHPKLWLPFSFAAGSLIPAAFVAFMHAFAPAEGALARRLLRPLLLIWVMAGILFSILSLMTDLVISEPSSRSSSSRPGRRRRRSSSSSGASRAAAPARNFSSSPPA